MEISKSFNFLQADNILRLPAVAFLNPPIRFRQLVGCELKIAGGFAPPTLLILSQNSGAFCGFGQPAIAINIKPILSASL